MFLNDGVKDKWERRAGPDGVANRKNHPLENATHESVERQVPVFESYREVPLVR